MGTLKHNVQKKQHRERSQLEQRRKYGLLEKHKDYVLRARDFHSKEDRLQKLRNNAAFRNKDEFYFGMINSRTEGGVHVQSRGNKALSADIVKLLKTQDVKYVQTARSVEETAIEKLREKLCSQIDLDLTGEDEEGRLLVELISPNQSNQTSKTLPKLKGKKTVFVDSIKQVDKKKFSEKNKQSIKTLTNDQELLIEELKSRLERVEKLREAESEMEKQRNLMGKGSKKKVTEKSNNNSDQQDDSDEEDGPVFPGSNPDSSKKSGKNNTIWKFKRERRR